MKILIVRNKEVNFIYGYNDKTLNIIKGHEKNSIIVASCLSLDDKKKLFYNNIAFSIIPSDFIFDKKRDAFFERQINIVLCDEDDTKNINKLKSIIDFINKEQSKKLDYNTNKGIKCYFFSDVKYKTIYNKWLDEGKGFIKFVNKYQTIAFDLFDKYPYTLFMNDKIVDYSTGFVNNNVDFNMVFIGFGNTNKHLYDLYKINNQFLVGSKKEKIVNYYIYDKSNNDYDRNINYDELRYKNEILSNDKNNYLELPCLTDNTVREKIDFDSSDFFTSIKANLKKNSYNYIFVSQGDDLANIDLALKLYYKLKEWDIDCHIFVKTDSKEISKAVEFNNIISFGYDNDVVYNLDNIINNKIELFSILRHKLYTEHKYNPSDYSTLLAQANDEWYNKLNDTKRLSNIYASLSLRTKLQLLGFDYGPLKDDKVKKEFDEKYQKSNPINYDANNSIVYTMRDITTDSLRTNMAYIEHNRWNAYMISNGYIPPKKDDLFESNDYFKVHRFHKCITTFKGLTDLRQLTISNLKDKVHIDEMEYDVIKYDYEILDNAAQTLEKLNLFIKEKE